MKKQLRKVLVLGALAGLFNGCATEEKKEYIHAGDFSYMGPASERQKVIDEQVFPEERHLLTSSKPVPRVEGFDNFQTENELNFPLGFHSIHRLFDDRGTFYVGMVGSMSYLISRNGKILTNGAHSILKRSNGLVLKTGPNEIAAVPPRNYAELSPNIWSEGDFEERADGLYVRGWDNFSKGN